MDFIRQDVDCGWVVCLRVVFYVLAATVRCVVWVEAAEVNPEDDDDVFSAGTIHCHLDGGKTSDAGQYFLNCIRQLSFGARFPFLSRWTMFAGVSILDGWSA